MAQWKYPSSVLSSRMLPVCLSRGVNVSITYFISDVMDLVAKDV